MLERYLKDIKLNYEKGDTTEPSFYEILKSLILKYSEKFLDNKVDVRILPKKTEGGNPDLKVSKEKNDIVGYIEVKDLSIENLDKIEKSEQLIRYRETFPNLILTNFFEFRLYKDGKLIDRVEIGRPFDIFKLKTISVSQKNKENFYKLLEKFFSYSLGKNLIELHLLKSEKLNYPISKFEGEGNNLVKFVKYDENEKKVYINEKQYFTNIDKDVWEYMIGGYQVLNKWLKDRKERYLSLDEILTYVKIVTSLKNTIDIQKQIDLIYPKLEENLIYT